MKPLIEEKKLATKLRKEGYSYNDILKQVPVAKSTLSSWLKDLALTNSEKEYLKTRADANISRGRIKAAAELRKQRKEREKKAFRSAQEMFQKNADEHLFQVGIALYWSEGSKRGNVWQFTNSDEEMMELMILWVEKYLNISRKKLHLQLYIHRAYLEENNEIYWSERLKIPIECFRKTVIKSSSKQYKIRSNYRGCLRFELHNSLHYLRIMKVLQKKLFEHHNIK